MTTQRLIVLTLTIPAVAVSALLYWYQWSANPLLPSEVTQYMTTIEAQTQRPGARHDLPALRKFLSEDDGAPFYTVNLYNFHAVADYPADSAFGGTGIEAYDRFSRVMVSLMAKRGSHPVYGSNWDRIVIVRYRSRRDIGRQFSMSISRQNHEIDELYKGQIRKPL